MGMKIITDHNNKVGIVLKMQSNTLIFRVQRERERERTPAHSNRVGLLFSTRIGTPTADISVSLQRSWWWMLNSDMRKISVAIMGYLLETPSRAQQLSPYAWVASS